MTTPCELVQIEYQGNGTLSVFAFPFPYDFKTEVKVALWNNTTKKHEDILTTDATYPWEVNDANPTAVTFTGTVPPAPPTADVNEDPIFNIRIYRVTDMTDIRSVFNQGSAIRATDLNKNFEQLRYAIQEGKCQVPDKLLEYLDEYYWNNYSDVVYSTETWASNDQTIATTAALDARFQDEANETIISSETWVADDDKIATTQSLEQRFDTLIETDILVDATGLTKSASGGQTTVGIGANSVDLDRIKTADIVQTSAYSSTWDSVDNKVATVGALAARLDAVVSTSQPTTTQTGKFWYNPTEGINALYMWNGTVWKVLTSGTPYIPAGTTIVRYVDQVNGSDDVNNLGFLPQSPLKTIKRAITLINASATGDGTLVVVEPGVYQEALPLTIQKNNVSVVGKSLRSCFIHPTVATENSNMWEVDSGTYISGFTMLGLKVPTSDQGSRNNAVDNDATYGLPSNQPFAVSFRSGNPVILKSPYVQNCTHFSDAHFDNANFDPNTFPSTDAQTYSAVAGDETSAPCGGGLLVDGSVPATTSPIRSMVVDAFTQITLDGPGILVTNNGYAQLVSFFGTFCHYHAKAKNGGQINLSNCVTDFGRYGLIAEGKSPTAIASATASAASSGATTVTIGAITSAGSFHGTVSRPLDHMMLTVDGNDYGVVSSTANGSGWDVTITPALSQTISNTAVTFALRSYISTGGHTFEYVGVGTDYSDHPDNGGVAIEANQVKQLSGGKVWQSSTDHIGKFKAGTVLTVDQIAETLAVNGSITVTGTNAINGNITVTGTVDGRDVATDGTKLDGIETGATADQTAAEIRTLVEAASDSNVFTDADHTKLNGIEASATADQTNAEIRTAVEAATDSNVFTDADHTKLNGIATGATAYANSNVDAHLNQSTASNGELLSWNGSDYDWIAAAAGYSDSSVDTHLNRSTAATGEVLSWNGSDYDWVASGGLSNNATGTNSLGVGTNALNSETNGSINIAFGGQALDATTTGYNNVAIGYQALKANLGGVNNTATGRSSLQTNTEGYHNTAFGYLAGGSITDGHSNTTIGAQAGDNITTGDNNIVIGNSADASSATVDNEITLGNTSISSLRIPGLQNGAANGTVLTYNSSNGNIDLVAPAGLTNNATYVQSLGVGTGALDSESASGHRNTAFGYNAGTSVTDGTYNILIGGQAGDAITTGTKNVAVGYDALSAVTTGGMNTAIGYECMQHADPGATNNTAVGQGASAQISTGTYNVSLGNQAGSFITAGSKNTAVGGAALIFNTIGDQNTATGYSALYANTEGGYNTAVGFEALKSNTTGTYGCAFGHLALRSNLTGLSNIAIGERALYTNTAGHWNVGIGWDALKVNTVSFNIGIGYNAGIAVTTGAENVLIGKSAGVLMDTGESNVCIGKEAGDNITSGSFNIVIGENATASSATVSNELTLGDTGINSLRIPGLQAGASNGQVLTYNSSNGNIAFATAGGAAALGDLSDGATSSTSLLLGTGVSTASSQNTVVGQNAGAAIDSSKNTYVGNEAGRYIEDEENTGIGNQALGGRTGSNQTGTIRRNTAVGDQSLAKLANGAVDNTAVGAYSGDAITIGQSNTLIGSSAGSDLTTESSNTFVGHGCGDDTTTSNNTGLGAYVLDDNTAGTNNTASGYRALYKNTAGANNVAHGNEALYFNTTGDDNVGIGHNANRGRSGHTASLTTAVGTKALFINTTGDQVTALGAYACKENTTGDDNTGVGYGALQNNETGANNTAVGVQALYNHTGGTTTAVGMKAGFSQTGSNSCVYLGWYAGFGATGASAANNTCLGAMAGYGLTSGTNNTAAGYQALYTNTTGARNVAMGVSAMKTSIDASNNVIIGHEAGESLTNGDDNVAIGNSAGKGLTNAGNCVAVGEKALEVANQDGNTAVGYRAGQAQSSGENNTYIGKQAGLGNTAGSNTTIIGNSATSSSTTVSNEFTLGNSSISSLRCNTQTISSLSDGRDKTEVEDLPLGLNFIDTLRPVKFKWDTRDGNGKDGSFEAGFIAQDLQSAQSTSNADYLKMVMDENPDRLEAAYGQLIPVLVQAIKDLSTQVKQLQTA